MLKKNEKIKFLHKVIKTVVKTCFSEGDKIHGKNHHTTNTGHHWLFEGKFIKTFMHFLCRYYAEKILIF